jgi:hypothetical protein
MKVISFFLSEPMLYCCAAPQIDIDLIVKRAISEFLGHLLGRALAK